MIPFDKEEWENYKKIEGKNIGLLVQLNSGEQKKFWGKIETSDRTNVLYIRNNSSEYDLSKMESGWDWDFDIQILRAGPSMLLMNWIKYNPGDYGNSVIEHDQFQLEGFKVFG
jgi:hypothetical protein